MLSTMSRKVDLSQSPRRVEYLLRNFHGRLLVYAHKTFGDNNNEFIMQSATFEYSVFGREVWGFTNPCDALRFRDLVV